MVFFIYRTFGFVFYFLYVIKHFFSILLTFFTLMYSQETDLFEFNIDNLNVYLNSNLTASFHGEVISTSPLDADLVLIKKDIVLPTDWQVSICIDNSCFNSSIDSVFFELLGHDTVEVIIDLIASNNISGSIELELSNIHNQNETIFKTLNVMNSLATITNERGLKNRSSLNFYPNPFNNQINFTLDLTYNDLINITIYNVNGSIIKNINNVKIEPGLSIVKWNGKNNKGQTVKTGIYFVRLKGTIFEDFLEITFLK